MATYLIKTAFCLSLFYLTYRILLDKINHFVINRIYLIGSFVLSFLIPLMTINLPLFTVQDISTGNYSLPANTEAVQATGALLLTGNSTETVFNQNHVVNLVTCIYLAGILFFSIRFGLDIFRLFRMIRKNRKRQYESYTLVLMDHPITPFSFFRYVFISSQDFYSGDYKSIILEHELVHIRAWHSIDRLFLGLGQIIQWFNPVIILYRKTLISLHEFSADYAVIKNTASIDSYTQRIMQYGYKKNNIMLTSQLGDTITKKRFIMMTQQKTGKLKAIRVFIAAIIAVFMLLAFSSGDKILVKPSSENLWQDISQTITDKEATSVKTFVKDTTGNVRQPESDLHDIQKSNEDEDIRILSDELQKMKPHRSDSIFYRPYSGPVMDYEMFMRHMAEKQNHWFERQRSIEEMQRKMEAHQRIREEQLKPMLELHMPTIDAKKLKEIAEAQARIEAMKPMLDEFLKQNPIPEPFDLREKAIRLKDLPPFIGDQSDIYCLPHPGHLDHLKLLDENNKEMLEKHKQWQEKYNREMEKQHQQLEKQHQQLENKRKQLLKEYNKLMKKYLPEG